MAKIRGHKYSGLEPNPSQQMNIGDWTGQSINNNIEQPQSYQQAGQQWLMGENAPMGGLVGGTSTVQQIPTSKLVADSAINLGTSTIQGLAAQQAAQNIKTATEGAGFFSRMGNSFSGMGSAAGGAAIGAGVSLLQNVGKNEEHDDGMMDRLDPMHYLSNGRHSTGGDITEKLGVGMFAAGASTFNPYLMLAGAATKIVGDVVNAGWGHKTDEQALAKAKAGTNYLTNYNSTAKSFDDLKNPMAFNDVGDIYEGGWFNKRKWNKKNDEIQTARWDAQQQAQNQFENNLNNLQQDQMYNALTNYAAFGGTLSTQGSDWRTGLTFVGNGGSHESNPYGGIPMGIAPDGQPNLVEEGEVIYKINGNPYVYSKRLKMPQAFKDKYKFKGETFADAATQAQKEIEERPNDPIAKRGLDDMMGIIAGEQEKVRQKKAERQAKYALGGWLTDGHKFATGSIMDGPPPRILFRGKYPLTLASDGLHYEGDVMGSRYKVTAKDAFANPDDYSTLLDEVNAIAQKNTPIQTPSYIKYKGYDGYISDDGSYYNISTNAGNLKLPVKDFMKNVGFNSDYIIPDAPSALSDVERAEMAALEQAQRQGVPLTDKNAGHIYYGMRPAPLAPVNSNWDWHSTLLDGIGNWRNPKEGIVTQYEQPTSTPTTTTSTTTSKKGTSTGTTTNRGTTGRQLTDAEKSMQAWLYSNPENFALANKAASEYGAREFKDANDIWKVALTGNKGPAYYGIGDAYKKANTSAWDDLVGRPSFKAEYPTPDDEMKAALASSADRFYNTEEGVEAKQRAYERANGIVTDASQNPNHRATWLRYAPVIGSALAVLTDPWLNRPDYRNADLVLEAGNSAKDVSFRPIGDYLPYKPFDRLFYANQLAAQQGATRRALLNTTGGNASTARGLLLAADNQGINQMGDLWRKAEEYNADQRLAVADFNRGTNMFNSEGFLKADMANQGQGNVRINAAMEAAKLREIEDNRVAETRSANFTNLFNNLGNIGRENFVWNHVSENPALYYRPGKGGSTDYKGNSDGYDIFQQNMDRWNKEHTAALGGYITIK